MERTLVTLLLMFFEITGSLSQEQFNLMNASSSAVPVVPPPPPSPSPPPPASPPPPSSSPPPPYTSPPPPPPSSPSSPPPPPLHSPPPPPPLHSPPPPPPPHSPPPPPRSSSRPPPPPRRREGTRLPGVANSTVSGPPPPQHLNASATVTKINLGKKIGFLFAAIAIVLQVAVVGFLVFKRRQISKFEKR